MGHSGRSGLHRIRRAKGVSRRILVLTPGPLETLEEVSRFLAGYRYTIEDSASDQPPDHSWIIAHFR